MFSLNSTTAEQPRFHDGKPFWVGRDKEGQVNYREWQVQGFFHREMGPAIETTGEDDFFLYRNWLEKEDFEKVITQSASKHIPVWVSWLLHRQVITMLDVESLLSDDGTWPNDIPYSWALKAWGINLTTYSRTNDIEEAEINWKAFIDILDYQASVQIS